MNTPITQTLYIEHTERGLEDIPRRQHRTLNISMIAPSGRALHTRLLGYLMGITKGCF